MISHLIVYSSLLMAGLFTLVYLLKADLRERVEKPKFVFLQQLAKYDSYANVQSHSLRRHTKQSELVRIESDENVANSGGEIK